MITSEDGNADVVENSVIPETETSEVQGSEEVEREAGSSSEQTAESTVQYISKDAFDARMARSTRQKHQMQSTIDELRAEINAMKDAGTKKPLTKQDFGNDDEAWIEHVAEQKAQKIYAENARQMDIQRQQAEQIKAINNMWQDKISRYKQEAPDYESVVTNSDIELTPTALQDIMESDVGPQIAYYLAKNPNEASKIKHMDQRQYDRYFAKLEMKFENGSVPTSKPEVKVSMAPKPVEPLTGKSNQSNAISLEDWVRQRNEEDRKRGML